MSNSATPVRTYLLVFVALLALLALTVLLAFVDLGPWNTVAALAVAGAKALLVILYFMHLRYDPPLIRLAAAGGFFWLLILIGLVLADTLTRRPG